MQRRDVSPLHQSGEVDTDPVAPRALDLQKLWLWTVIGDILTGRIPGERPEASSLLFARFLLNRVYPLMREKKRNRATDFEIFLEIIEIPSHDR